MPVTIAELEAVAAKAGARRRKHCWGMATAVTAAPARAAAAHGATGLCLQVEEGNEAAHALYLRCGFTDHHR